MMVCADAHDEILTYGGGARASALRHVASCAECSAFATRAWELDERIRALASADVPPTWAGLARRDRVIGPAPTFSSPGAPPRSVATVWAALAHAACLFVGLAVASQPELVDVPKARERTFVFWSDGGDGAGGGGGGGGAGGAAPSADADAAPAVRVRSQLAPRLPRELRFDDVSVPELPVDTRAWLDGRWSESSVETPGIDWDAPDSVLPADMRRSAGDGDGTGGGVGGGVGEGVGDGAGPGWGDGQGGGPFRPGAWDVAPVLLSRDPDPPYPRKAREMNVEGEVILQILVHVDGTTEVVSVLKSLPHCMGVAREAARSHRWRPALANGQPVAAYGVITVRFEMFSTK